MPQGSSVGFYLMGATRVRLLVSLEWVILAFWGLWRLIRIVAEDFWVESSLSAPDQVINWVGRRPDFFIVGAPKCGTTALDVFLNQHPEIFMSRRKESHFFASDMPGTAHIRDPNRFNELFSGVCNEKRVGEASVWHLASTEAAVNIHRFNPDALIIVMLRNPVEMIPSLHSQLIFEGYEDVRDLRRALRLESARLEGLHVPTTAPVPVQLQYRNAATYAPQLRRYLDLFGRDRVHVILYDDFAKDPDRVFSKLLEFLGVDPRFRPEFSRVNANKVVGSLFLRDLLKNPPNWVRRMVRYALPGQRFRHGLIRRLEKINVKEMPRNATDADLIEALRKEFLEANRELSSLIGRDLSSWNHPDTLG